MAICFKLLYTLLSLLNNHLYYFIFIHAGSATSTSLNASTLAKYHGIRTTMTSAFVDTHLIRIKSVCSSTLNHNHMTASSLNKLIVHHHPLFKQNVKQYNTMNDNNNNKTENKSMKPKGVYSRPSAAIEKGSGFYIPFLEGSRVRTVFGIFILLFVFLNNHYILDGDSTSTDGSLLSILSSKGNESNNNEVSSFVLSEYVSTFYAILLLIQGFIELAKERGLGLNSGSSTSSQEGRRDNYEKTSMNNKVKSNDNDSMDTSTNNNPTPLENAADSKNLLQVFSNKLNNDSAETKDVIRWIAASYIALTPATHIMLMEQQQNDASGATAGSILYSLGDFSTPSNNDQQMGISKAIDTVYQSKGGRVALPADHPSSIALLPEDYRRCVLLQRVIDDNDGNGRRMCLLVGSDKLLPAFTKNDLKWLGSLAGYLMQTLQ